MLHCNNIGAGSVQEVRNQDNGDLVMAIAASFVDSAREPPAARQPGFLKRLVDALAASHTRMYLAAITDPATGCIDPVRERAVLRAMVL